MVTSIKIEQIDFPVAEFEVNTHPSIKRSIYLEPVTQMGVIPMEEVGVAEPGYAFKESTLLGTMNDARLRVRQPFQVTMATENDDFIAEAEEIDEFGFGKNPSAAVRDLQLTIVELYFTLKNEAHRLGPDLKRVFSVLESKLDPTHDD